MDWTTLDNQQLAAAYNAYAGAGDLIIAGQIQGEIARRLNGQLPTVPTTTPITTTQSQPYLLYIVGALLAYAIFKAVR